MGRQPRASRAAQVQKGRPPRPPVGGGGVTRPHQRSCECASCAGLHVAAESARRTGKATNALLSGLIDAVTIMSLLPPRAATNTPPIPDIAAGKPKGNRPPPVAKQVQVSGAGSVNIQSGGDITNVTISASNGSVAAWTINGAVNVGAQPAPPLPPTCQSDEPWTDPWPDDAPLSYPYKAQIRVLVGSSLLLLMHTVWLLVALFVLAEPGDTTWVTWVSLVLNPIGMAYHGRQLWHGVWERRSVRAEAAAARTIASRDPQFGKPTMQPICTWDTRQFIASCECPNHRCGAIGLHHLRAPGAEDPAFAEGVVIRTCTTCGQEWTER